MGLLIHTSFETPQGFPVSSVYCRITRFTFDPQSGGRFLITMKTETFLSRDARLTGKQPVTVPNFPDLFTVEGVFGDMQALYAMLKTTLESSGFTVENVDPDPEPAPAPEPESATVPTEPAPEPEPAPSEPAPSEPAPSEPAPSEPTPAPEASL